VREASLRLFCGVDKVAAVTVRTITFVQKTEAWFGFVGSIRYSVASKLFGSVGKLALGSIRAKAVNHEIFAEGAFDLR